MVGQLLKDVVEAAERPPAANANLTSTATSSAFDRFGFRIDAVGDSSLEEKAERLRRQAEDVSETAAAEVS